MLSTAELTGMRAEAARWFPNSGVIMRSTAAKDTIGAPKLTWTAAGTVDCRLIYIQRQSMIQGEGLFSGSNPPGGSDRLKIIDTWRVTMAHDEDLLVSDRVVIDSVTYEVVKVDAGREWAITKTAEIKRLI